MESVFSKIRNTTSMSTLPRLFNILLEVLATAIKEKEIEIEKLQYYGHLMQRADSLEKTLMLGKIEGRRKRG